jgi:hypothetical protein
MGLNPAYLLLVGVDREERDRRKLPSEVSEIVARAIQAHPSDTEAGSVARQAPKPRFFDGAHENGTGSQRRGFLQAVSDLLNLPAGLVLGVDLANHEPVAKRRGSAVFAHELLVLVADGAEEQGDSRIRGHSRLAPFAVRPSSGAVIV